MATKKSFRPKILAQPSEADSTDALEFYENRTKWAEYLSTMDDLSDRAFRVGYWLSRRMNGDDKCCWYSVQGIAKRMGKSQRTIRYAIAELRERNVLIVIEEAGKQNCYFIHAPFF